MTLDERRRQAECEHVDGMAELKAQLDQQILAQAACTPGAAPAPFGVTMAAIEQERQRLIDSAETAKRRAWKLIAEADQLMQAVEDEGEYDDDSVVTHDEFIAGIEADKAAALRRLDDLKRLVSAFNNARLDVFNALREGNSDRARQLTAAFVRRPAIAP